MVVALLIASNLFSQERFEFNRIGFGIDVPTNWIAMKDEEVYKNLNLYDFTEEQLAKLLKADNASLTLCTYVKYDPKTVSGIIPTVKIRTKNCTITDKNEFLKFVKMMNDPAKMPLDDFRFSEQPTLTTIANHEAVRFAVQFTLKNAEKEYHIVSNSYYILRDGYFISLNFLEEIGKEDNTALFENLVKSVQITK